MLPSRNGLRAEKLSNGNSMESQRPLDPTTGLHMLSLWNQTTLDAEATTQDGSNSSLGKLHSLEIRRKPTRSWMFQVVLMPKTEISTCGNSKVENNSNGILSMKRTGRVNQEMENGTENGVSLSIETSTLSQD
jgi:hypothetical protein